MRTALVRRTVLTASAVSLTLLATACGTEKDGTKAEAGPAAGASSAAPSPAAPVVKGKTDAELGALILTQADLPDQRVKPTTPADVVIPTSKKPECLPLVQVQSLVPVGTSTGVARAKTISAGQSIEVGGVALASYEGTGAQAAFAALKAAGTACAGGYEGAMTDEPLKVTKVAPGAALTAGDETLTYAVTNVAEGEEITLQYVVVRKGNTLASFMALNASGTAAQPKAAVEAQVKKLG